MGTPTFEQAAENIARHDQTPAAYRSQQLAPARAELEKVWKEFLKKRPGYDQRLYAAGARRQLAAAQGVLHQPLEQACGEIYGDGNAPGLMVSIENKYKSTVASIEHPTAAELNLVNVELALPNAPSQLRALVGRLGQLVDQVERMTGDGGDLHRLMMARVPGAPAGHVAPEQPRGIKTESDVRV